MLALINAWIEFPLILSSTATYTIIIFSIDDDIHHVKVFESLRMPAQCFSSLPTAVYAVLYAGLHVHAAMIT